ncbi:MAG: hypothetical protein ACKOWD_07810 [Rhodoferax sp.]
MRTMLAHLAFILKCFGLGGVRPVTANAGHFIGAGERLDRQKVKTHQHVNTALHRVNQQDFENGNIIERRERPWRHPLRA